MWGVADVICEAVESFLAKCEGEAELETKIIKFPTSLKKWQSTDHCFQFQKRSQLFVGVHNEALTVIAVCVNNPDRSPFRIHG